MKSRSASPSVPIATESDTRRRLVALMAAVEQHKYLIEQDPNDASFADDDLWRIFGELEDELWAAGE